MRNSIQHAVCVVGALGLWAAQPAAAQERETRFTIIESVGSTWVSRGLDNYTVTPDDGWTFQGGVGTYSYSNDVRVYLSGPPLPAAPSVDYWEVRFEAPGHAVLTTGFYDNATRWPFQEFDEPAMDFSSTGRGDNRLLADFDVLEVAYNDDGSLFSLAVDFVYYGEQRLNEPVTGEIRYNALVPEPTSAVLVSAGGLFLLRRRR